MTSVDQGNPGGISSTKHGVFIDEPISGEVIDPPLISEKTRLLAALRGEAEAMIHCAVKYFE
jgi:hypothetical protein